MAKIAMAPVSEVEELRVIEALEWPCGYRNNAQSRLSCMNELTQASAAPISPGFQRVTKSHRSWIAMLHRARTRKGRRRDLGRSRSHQSFGILLEQRGGRDGNADGLVMVESESEPVAEEVLAAILVRSGFSADSVSFFGPSSPRHSSDVVRPSTPAPVIPQPRPLIGSPQRRPVQRSSPRPQLMAGPPSISRRCNMRLPGATEDCKFGRVCSPNSRRCKAEQLNEHAQDRRRPERRTRIANGLRGSSLGSCRPIPRLWRCSAAAGPTAAPVISERSRYVGTSTMSLRLSHSHGSPLTGGSPPRPHQRAPECETRAGRQSVLGNPPMRHAHNAERGSRPAAGAPRRGTVDDAADLLAFLEDPPKRPAEAADRFRTCPYPPSRLSAPTLQPALSMALERCKEGHGQVSPYR